MKTVKPLGKLIAIGGNEDKGTYSSARVRKKYYLNFFELGILKRVVTESGKVDPRIEVVTTASMIPEEVGEIYRSSFTMLNCHNVGVMDIRTPEDARQPEYLERLRSCDLIMFSGGNQSRLKEMFGESEFLDLLTTRYQTEPSFVMAGTSAGAMAMSHMMIRGGSVPDALLKGAVKMGHGLGLLNNVVIDTHFVKRGRFGRLIEAVSLYPKLIGIGLGEDTGILITDGNVIETIGSNLVIIMDGKSIQHNNAPAAKKGTALSVEHMTMHVLAKGNVYNMQQRQFYVDRATHDAALAAPTEASPSPAPGSPPSPATT
ncbi:cyanophycinase [Hymenobacter lutimineralis]|uniref:Cyanophycinase n=1 Tax=Hymenobacter lutimineralis TaxID=2606448 RepID=A0A5D6VIE9_9BACT|nr:MULTISPECIES: cyanophycinase [Hymenobacter]QIX59996.1 cyanophycinase [Hymenobacter sp. BT18]TYZ14569.1 cyanophycinase [Hymenobacter lutimineralis]